MKIKGLIIALGVGPIIGWVLVQVLWRTVWAFAWQYMTLESYSDLMIVVFAISWVCIAYKGYKISVSVNEMKGRKKAVKRKPKLNPFERDFTLKDVTQTFRPSVKNALLEFIIIGNGKNLHQVMPYTKDAKYTTASGKQITVSNDDLRIKKPLFGKIKLIAVINSVGEPVKQTINGEEPSAEILYLAKRSNVYSDKSKSTFASNLPLKKILFFVILGVVAVVVIFVLIGGGLF